MRLITILAALLASVSLLPLGGCAFGDRHIMLTYKPTAEPYEAAGRVAVVTFEDQRPRERKQDIGEVRNGFGTVTANVRIDTKGSEELEQHLGVWIADALVEELKSAGADAVRCDSEADAGAYPVVVTGSIQKVWISMYIQYDTVIRTRVRIQRAGATVFDDEVKGDAEEMAIVGSRGEYQDALAEGLQDWLRNAVPRVIEHTR